MRHPPPGSCGKAPFPRHLLPCHPQNAVPGPNKSLCVGETSVTTLICLAPVPHSAGGTGAGGVGMALFRKTLVAGVAYLFVAGFAEAQPLHTNGWSNSPPVALNPPARKKQARPAAAAVSNKASKKDESKNSFGEMSKGPLQ